MRKSYLSVPYPHKEIVSNAKRVLVYIWKNSVRAPQKAETATGKHLKPKLFNISQETISTRPVKT